MTLPTQFSLLDSEFNEFLFATVGEERIGVPLSVLSAFARLGLDPWVEAVDSRSGSARCSRSHRC